jgi:hypothetical protein
MLKPREAAPHACPIYPVSSAYIPKGIRERFRFPVKERQI